MGYKPQKHVVFGMSSLGPKRLRALLQPVLHCLHSVFAVSSSVFNVNIHIYISVHVAVMTKVARISLERAAGQGACA